MGFLAAPIGIALALGSVAGGVSLFNQVKDKNKIKPTSPTEPLPTGALDDNAAQNIAKNSNFRRNLFLSPTAFVRGSLGNRTGRSQLSLS